jgi:Cdc6-like AAA superfamily ATPase
MWVDCLNSLSVKAVNTRRAVILDGLEATGDWLYNDKAYKKWHRDSTNGLLWIQGKPGSGKSTLLKKILRELLLHNNLTERYESLERPDWSFPMLNASHVNRQSQSDSQAKICTVIASFFYSLRQVETSHVQMLQTLLHQLLKQEPRLYPILRDAYRRLRHSGQSFNWELKDLKPCFQSLASFRDFPLKVYFVIDAMDESEAAGRPEVLSLL